MEICYRFCYFNVKVIWMKKEEEEEYQDQERRRGRLSGKKKRKSIKNLCEERKRGDC